MRTAAFQFIDAARTYPLIDRELELVEPQERYVDAVLAACHHPLTRQEMPQQAQTTRQTLEHFLLYNLRGRTEPEPDKEVSPTYTFWMRIRPLAMLRGETPVPSVTMAGSISLRIGYTPNLEMYLGNVGYHVLPPARGHHFAERAVRLILPIARAHGMRYLWITANPENSPSRRTCENLNGEMMGIVPVPRDNALWNQGDRQKCRYRIML